jgi:hypothetical protein
MRKTKNVKVKGYSKERKDKAKYMSDEAFAALRRALEEAVAFEQGKRQMNVIRIPATRLKPNHEPR